MTARDVERAFKKAKFHFAKTMPRIPHYYTLRREWEDRELFRDIVVFIRENGRDVKFYSKTYRCFNVGGWRYWTMGEPIPECDLINRRWMPDEDISAQKCF